MTQLDQVESTCLCLVAEVPVPHARPMTPLECRRLARTAIDAMLRGEIEVHYQPQIDLETGVPASLEALVRWVLPDGTIVPPGDFLPAVEAADRMDELTAWVLRTAARQLADWQHRAVVTHGFRIAVNVPASVFARNHLANLVRGVLAETGLEARDLVIELTESDRLSAVDGAAAEAQRLRSILGVDLSLDDFGTGWSSLALLHQVGAEELKIDRSFVQDLTNPTCRTLVEAVVRMARNLGMRVVAEGVETDEQLVAAREVGCDLGQGWYWAAAQTPDSIEAMLCGAPAVAA
jgi:EAL domain-containing protein (putative c-di-GMP-specific phosphodiesterase class I)